MGILFIVMCLIISGVIVYLIKDYMNYKDNVDKSFDITNKDVNKNFLKVEENINITEKNLKSKIDKNTNEINNVNKKTDEIDNNINDINSSLLQIKKEDEILKNYVETDDYRFNLLKDNYNNNINTINNNFKYVDDNYNLFKDKYNEGVDVINNNFTMLQENDKNILKNDENTLSFLNNFDQNLNKYFKFIDNDLDITNKKIFEHVLSGINPNIQLLSKVNAISGMTINTSPNKHDNKNLKICNSKDNCLNMNVDDSGFNITPENVNQLLINSINDKPLANFDLKNEGIYLGGNDKSSPLYIEKGRLFLNANKTDIVSENNPIINYDIYMQSAVQKYVSAINNGRVQLLPVQDTGMINNVIYKGFKLNQFWEENYNKGDSNKGYYVFVHFSSDDGQNIFAGRIYINPGYPPVVNIIADKHKTVDGNIFKIDWDANGQQYFFLYEPSLTSGNKSNKNCHYSTFIV